MAAEYRHAGIHWPENAGGEHPSRDAIVAMPGMAGATLICSPSARYHYEFIRQRCPSAVVVWRAIPRQGKLPAQLNWIGKAIADECLNLWDEQPHHGTEWFTPLNELQFLKESGEMFRGYGYVAAKLADIRIALQDRFRALGQDVRLIFPAWVPMDDGDHLDDWRGEAEQWDAIGLHCYGDAGTMQARYLSYRNAFPGKLLFVGEWNSNHEYLDEQESLQMWAEVAAPDPLFLGAAYYIWETNNAGENDLSIWGDPERLALFRDPPTAQEPAPEPEPMPPPTLPIGLDVASYQGYPDWAQVAASGITFAITKATESTNYTNPTFGHNWRQIKGNGMYRGAYHFARPDNNAPEAEADYFLGVVESRGLEEGDLLALDLEAGTGDLSDWVLRWLRHVEGRVGFKPLLYTAKGYIDGNHLGNRPELAEYGLWLASWQANMPPAPAPWDVIAFWQYADTGQVPGIVGPVDHNVFNGSAERIPLYGKPAAEPVPVPEPVPPAEYAVGPGILAKMAEAGDSPASDELYYPAGAGHQYSEAFGRSGSRYVYVVSANQTYRFDPAA